jgi:hypothetical protein
MEAKSCADSGEATAGTPPFPEPLHNPCCGWSKLPGLLALAISLRMQDFNFVARLLVVLQRQLIGQPARDWSRPTFKGQFPFPLAPEFWGS